jgi:DNA-binding NarL/FixJ family response regulator
VLTTPHPLPEPPTSLSAVGHMPWSVRAGQVVPGLTPERPRACTGNMHASVSTSVTPPTYSRAGLSQREIAVLKAWFDCDSKVGAAARLHIALGTINTHLVRIRDKYAKVGRPAPTKAALVARALQDGFVTLDDL